MTNKKNILLLFVGIISFSLSTIFSLYTLNKLVSENDKDKSVAYANEVAEKVNNLFSRPKSVALSIDNSFIYDYVKNPNHYSKKELDSTFKKYLSGLIERFGYETAYIASLANLNYYTEHGFSVYLDPKVKDNDWFMDFIKSGQEFELKVDNDQANNNRITVYINVRMEEPNGNVIGACGIGIDVDSISDLIDQFNLVDGYTAMIVSKNGKIQISSDVEHQNGSLQRKKEYFWHEISPTIYNEIKNYDTEINYKIVPIDKNSFYIIHYMDEFEWYLVMEYFDITNKRSSVIYKNIFVWASCLLVLLAIIFIYNKKYQLKLNDFKTKSEVDRLTGLLNRQSYEEKKQSLSKIDSLKDLSAIVIDIDSLKKVNDTIGHDAGDELIRGAAKLIKNYFSPYGTAYRSGGDEFIIIMNKPFILPEENIKSFKKLVSKWRGSLVQDLHVSVGFASCEQNNCKSIDELVKTADVQMYQDKRKYYKTIDKDRRKR